MIDSYRKLPLGKYKEICAICRDDARDEVDRQVGILSVLSDMTEDDLLSMPIIEYQSIARQADFLRVPSTENHSRISDRYFLGGFDLVPCYDIRKITTAQYIDFQNFAPDAENKVAEILSCFMIPRGKTYAKDYDVLDVHRALNDNLSVAEALSLSAFFLSRFRQLIRDTLTYSKREAQGLTDSRRKTEILTRIEEQLTLLNRSGVGSRMSMPSVKRAGVRGMMFGICLFWNSLTSSVIERTSRLARRRKSKDGE